MRFIHGKERSTGLVVPLLAVRTDDRACGEFPDIAALASLAKLWGMNLIQLLPVNDSGWQSSPYSALSSIALNPVYLRIEDLPEVAIPVASAITLSSGANTPGRVASPANLAATREKIKRIGEDFSGRRRVSYGELLSRKLRVLAELWEESFDRADTSTELDAWVEKNAWVRPYACFLELKKRFGGLPWWSWPRYRYVGEKDIGQLWSDADFSKDLRFWAWLQMRAQQQFSAACGHAHSMWIDVMGDIPILMNRDSADAWCNGGIFDFGFVAGAPPDSGAPAGQNWGFPLYRWEAIEKSGWDFWKKRLAAADLFYTSYRIDHVLGFFRIWAIGQGERDGYLGHFEPESEISREDLRALGFDDGRIRWLSQPHIPAEVVESIAAAAPAQYRASLKTALFSQIGSEPLYLFSSSIHGSADFDTIVGGCTGSDATENAATIVDELVRWWRNRTLLELPSGQFAPTQDFWNTQAWRSLSESEKSSLGSLIEGKKQASNQCWLQNGRKILSSITAGVPMQPCAEDLGYLSPGIPETLADLRIPGLRVLRWTRHYDQPGAPFVPLDEYPEQTVACTSVHDSASMRQWWREEPDRDGLWRMLQEALPEACWHDRSPRAVPDDLDPDTALFMLKAFAKVNSRIVVYPIQDVLAAHETYREAKAEDERINVPATCDEFDWTYRMKPSVAQLLSDADFAARISAIAKIHGAARDAARTVARGTAGECHAE